jgi:predicted helicase
MAPLAPEERRGEGSGVRGIPYEPFEGILLTDTFAMYEDDDKLADFFPDNSIRRKRQKKLDVRVIVGNPPYSIGQTSETDNNKNIKYTLESPLSVIMNT